MGAERALRAAPRLRRVRRDHLDWFFILFYSIFIVLAMVLDITLGTFSLELKIGLLSGCFSLAMLIPYLAVTVRRLHDTDRRSWWFLIWLIPIAGAIWLIVLMVLDGHTGEKLHALTVAQVPFVTR